MDLLHNIVAYLDDPYLVASFQKFCGLTLNTDDTPNKSDNAIYGISGISNPSIVFRDEDDPRMTYYEEQNGEIIKKFNEDDLNTCNSSEIDSLATLSSKTANTVCVQRKPNLTPGEIKKEASEDDPIKTSHQNGDILAKYKNMSPSKSSPAKCRLPYKINNKTLYYVFSFGAALGNELFYTTFFPFILWNIDAFICRKIVVMWWIILYAGQATKDILKRPRPLSPPVIKLEARYELEYGMPSTHAMVGTCIPFTMLFIADGRYEVRKKKTIFYFVL